MAKQIKTKYERACNECGYDAAKLQCIIDIIGISGVKEKFLHFAEVLEKHQNMTECCENCRFYKQRKGEVYDHCRLNPPVIVEVSPNKYGDKNYRSKYPEISRYNWCGQYEYNPDWELSIV